MSITHEKTDGHFCPFCAKHEMTITYEDAWGHEWRESTCQACGYKIEQDIGCGSDWDDANWTANKIEGITVHGAGNLDKKRRVPGSLAATQSSYVTSLSDWVIFVTKEDVTVVKGGPFIRPKFDELVTNARVFLASIKMFEHSSDATQESA